MAAGYARLVLYLRRYAGILIRRVSVRWHRSNIEENDKIQWILLRRNRMISLAFGVWGEFF